MLQINWKLLQNSDTDVRKQKGEAAENYRKILSKYQMSTQELSIVHSRNDEIGIASRIKSNNKCIVYVKRQYGTHLKGHQKAVFLGKTQ